MGKAKERNEPRDLAMAPLRKDESGRQTRPSQSLAPSEPEAQPARARRERGWWLTITARQAAREEPPSNSKLQIRHGRKSKQRGQAKRKVNSGMSINVDRASSGSSAQASTLS